MTDRLYLRSRVFPGDNYNLYWSEGQHAWGSLASASVYTQDEVKSFKHRPELPNNHATYMSRHGHERYVPGEGEWEPLPDILKLKTVEEWLA